MKKSALIIAAVLSSMMLTACEEVPDTVPVDGTPESSQAVSAAPANNTEAAKKEISAADITAAVTAEIEISSAIEKTAENIGAFYDVDTSAVTDMSVFICGSGAYPDELAVFRFTDADSAKAGAEAVQTRLDSQLALYKDYTPDEFYKLEGAAVIQKDTWVIFAACSDNEKAKEIIEEFI